MHAIHEYSTSGSLVINAQIMAYVHKLSTSQSVTVSTFLKRPSALKIELKNKMHQRLSPKLKRINYLTFKIFCVCASFM
jgi:hypothetical protein